MRALPLIDVSAWGSPDVRAHAALARQVDDACREIGFLQIVGHGLPAAVSAALRRETEAFFALPLGEKLACRPSRAGINRGYSAMGSEALAYSLGVKESPPDLFEAFNVGPDVVPDDEWHRQAPHDLFAPNIWPAGMEAMRVAVTAYFDHAVRVGRTLIEIFAQALSLPRAWFEPYVDRSTLTLRILNYEHRAGEAPPVPDQMRMGAHTDYGIVTILQADPVPGLQVLAPDGAWLEVIPEPDALLVNLGDLTAQWTNDRWRSTLHRVVPGPGAGGPAKRRSVALFFDGNYDARIACLPSCQDAAQPARYPPVIAGDHLIAKLLGPRTLAPSQARTNTASDRLSSAAPLLPSRPRGSG